MYLQFISFLHSDESQVVEILPHVRQDLTYSTWSKSWVMFGDIKSQGISNHDIDYIELE